MHAPVLRDLSWLEDTIRNTCLSCSNIECKDNLALRSLVRFPHRFRSLDVVTIGFAEKQEYRGDACSTLPEGKAEVGCGRKYLQGLQTTSWCVEVTYEGSSA